MVRVFIVEDEPRLAAFVEKGLRQSGYCTQTATNGQEALKDALSQAFDLIILDLGLPQLDGWAVLRELRQQGNQTPVIILTAQTDVRQRVLTAGADAYLGKPFRFTELLASVQDCLTPT